MPSLSLQSKKIKSRNSRGGGGHGKQHLEDPATANNTADGNSIDRSPSLQKISPLQQYILEQAKLSGYRYGDKIGQEKRDSFIDSESESHRAGTCRAVAVLGSFPILSLRSR